MIRLIKTTLLPALLLAGLFAADVQQASADRPFGIRVGGVGVRVGSSGGFGVSVAPRPAYYGTHPGHYGGYYGSRYGGHYGPVYNTPRYGHGGFSFWVGDRSRPSSPAPSTPAPSRPSPRPHGLAPLPDGFSIPSGTLRGTDLGRSRLLVPTPGLGARIPGM